MTNCIKLNHATHRLFYSVRLEVKFSHQDFSGKPNPVTLKDN